MTNQIWYTPVDDNFVVKTSAEWFGQREQNGLLIYSTLRVKYFNVIVHPKAPLNELSKDFNVMVLWKDQKISC